MEITDCQWVINVKMCFMYEIWKIVQLNINSTCQIVQKLLGKLRSKGELKFQEKPDIGCLLTFSVDQTLPLQNKRQNHPFDWDVGIQQINLSSTLQIFSRISTEF